MKIAIVTETFLPSTDGIVTRLSAAIRHYVRLGHEVCIIAPELGVTEFEGAPVFGVPARLLPFYRTKPFALPSRRVKHYLQSFRPDVVHVVNPALMGVSGIYYAKKLGYPLIASYHTNVSQYLDYYKLGWLKEPAWLYFRALHNAAPLNLCPSRTLQAELDARGFRNVHVWKSGVNTDLYHPGQYDGEMRMRLSQGDPDQTVLLYVGRLAKEKQIERLKDVFGVSGRFTLAIVGDGPHRQALERHFAGTSTVFMGYLHGQELAKAYASSDVFVFPSVTETFGLVLTEALASGLPVAAARSGPTSEHVRDGVTGALYDPGEPGGLAAAVGRFKDEGERLRMKAAALEESARRSWAEAAVQALEWYSQAAEERSREAAGPSQTAGRLKGVGRL